MITEDEFSAWRESPITEAVFMALGIKVSEARDRWMDASWKQGNPDPMLLVDLRARAEIAADIIELTHDELEQILDSQS